MVETPSQRLRRARLTAGFSSAGHFAYAHGFPAVTYRAHESGTRNFKVHSAQTYAAALGLPHPAGWRWLMFGDNSDQILAAVPLIRFDNGQLADERSAYIGSARQGRSAVGTSQPAALNSFTMIPLYDAAVSAGHGAALFDASPVDYLSFSPQLRSDNCAKPRSIGRAGGTGRPDGTDTFPWGSHPDRPFLRGANDRWRLCRSDGSGRSWSSAYKLIWAVGALTSSVTTRNMQRSTTLNARLSKSLAASFGWPAHLIGCCPQAAA